MGKNLAARLAEHDRLLSFAAMHQEFCFCCDIMQIALGRLGWGEYFKACLDRELARYTGASFVPYETRHRLPGEKE